MLLVVITVVLGFLIMFRSKIGGQTALSLETVLPRIVVTMIYISFSFAIAGFLIDMMYLMIGLVVDILLGYGLHLPIEYVAKVQDDFIGAKFHDLWPNGSLTGRTNGMRTFSAFSVGGALWDFIPIEFKGILDVFVGRTLTTWIAHTWAQKWFPLVEATENLGWEAFTFGFNIGKTLSGFSRWLFLMALTSGLAIILPSIILGLIIILTILLHMFKIFFILLSSYIKIMLYIMFAPIIILFEVIPGQSAFGWWFKNLIGELIAFPIVVAIMVTGQAIVLMINNPRYWSFGSAYTTTGQNIVSSFSGGDYPFTLPFLYGFRSEDFSMIVALGIILIIPDFIKMAKAKIGVQDSPLNFGLGTFFAGASMFVSGLGTAGSLQSYRHTLAGSSPFERQKGFLEMIPGMGGIAKWMRDKSTVPEAPRSGG